MLRADVATRQPWAHKLFPVLYDELLHIAHGRLAAERQNHTLSATALVHEAFIKLSKLNQISWQNKNHVLAVASQMMRNILVTYAVRRRSQKRGGDQARIPLEDMLLQTQGLNLDVLTLHTALEKLSRLCSRQVQIVECRFFGGLSIEETAKALYISVATVKRDWVVARAWLNRELATNTDVS